MIKMAKEITENGKESRALMNQLLDNRERSSKAPFIPSPMQPPRVSVVDHEGLASRFKMEIGFEQGKQWSQEQRQDHCIKLLTEVEELFREYGVEKLVGNYTRHGLV